MPSAKLRAVRLVTLTGLVALGLAACGGSSGKSAGGASGGGSAHAVEVAYTASLGAKTARFTLTETITADSTGGSTQNARITGSGALDFANNSMAMTMNSPSGGALHMAELNGLLFVDVPPAQRAQIPGHKPWIEVNLNQVDQAELGKTFSQLSTASSNNPQQVLSQLAAVSNRVTKLGTSSIGGVATTEYRGDVNLNKVAAQAQAKAGPKAAQQVRAREQALHTTTLPVTVWVDGNHLVRRLGIESPVPAGGTGAPSGHGTAAVTITFSGYGTPVTITPPPSSQVANVTSAVIAQAKSAG